MHLNIKYRILFFALISASFCASSQEFVKEAQVKCTESLVREVSSQSWMVYSYHYGMSVFSLVNEYGTIAPTLQLPLLYHVSDMEIYNDTVYFCGYIDSALNTALFGYFSIASFPSMTVRCLQLAGLNTFNKMEIFCHDGKPHVVLTGIMNKYHPFLADAITTTSNSWLFSVSSSANDNWDIYDDVAITDNYIVVTSRIFDYDTGYVHYFNKPPTYSSMFPYHFLYRTIQYNPTSSILITACDEDKFATLCKIGTNTFVMSKYNFMNDVVSLKSGMLDVECRDINFNNNAKEVEVLLYSSLVKNGAGITLHYDNAIMGSSMIPAHSFERNDLSSIDYLSFDPNLFVASGHLSKDELLRLYRYKYDEWFHCTGEKTIESNKIDNNYNSFKKDFAPQLIDGEAVETQCTVDEAVVSTICEY